MGEQPQNSASDETGDQDREAPASGFAADWPEEQPEAAGDGGDEFVEGEEGRPGGP